MASRFVRVATGFAGDGFAQAVAAKAIVGGRGGREDMGQGCAPAMGFAGFWSAGEGGATGGALLFGRRAHAEKRFSMRKKKGQGVFRRFSRRNTFRLCRREIRRI